jgi:hypothetical protein
MHATPRALGFALLLHLATAPVAGQAGAPDLRPGSQFVVTAWAYASSPRSAPASEPGGVYASPLDRPPVQSAERDRRKGAVRGAAVGLVVGGLIGGLSVGTDEDDEFGESIVESAATSPAVVLGAAFGAALGALIGGTVFAPARAGGTPDAPTLAIHVAPAPNVPGAGVGIGVRWRR